MPFYKQNRHKKTRTCGTHLGETKLVASTTSNPEATSISINLTFTAVGTMCFSFWSPSLGPTSTIFTNSGMFFNSWWIIQINRLSERIQSKTKFNQMGTTIRHQHYWLAPLWNFDSNWSLNDELTNMKPQGPQHHYQLPLKTHQILTLLRSYTQSSFVLTSHAKQTLHWIYNAKRNMLKALKLSKHKHKRKENFFELDWSR